MFEMTATATTAGSIPDSMYVWGLSVIHAFQGAGNPAITLLARFFSLLGEPIAYIIILPLLYWCIDEKRGFRLAIIAFLSNGINSAIKEQLRIPRPFYRDPSVKLADATGFSTPSGHAQNAAAFWPVLFLDCKTNSTVAKTAHFAIRLAASLVLPLCIGLSRIYLGVHYPTDVIFGWLLGTCLSVIVLCALPAVTRALSGGKDGERASILESLKSHAETGGRSLRSYKIALAALLAFFMNAISNDSSMGGAIFGFATGYIMLLDPPKRDAYTANADSPDKPVPARFSAASGSFAKKTARLLLGLITLIALFVALSKFLPGEGSPYYALCRFLRYGLVGFWASFGAPNLFLKTKLA